ncbi:MAG: PRC-barrel domain-containing protein [Ginsengibacter sp.]
MKRSIKSLVGYNLRETNGEIGKVDEFYFDDQSWTIRYLVVKTGSWLTEKKVLISPSALLMPDWQNKEFPVKLTKDQIENSPDIDTDQPVSRQQEQGLFSYYGWDGYWGTESGAHGAGIFGAMPSDLYNNEVEDNKVSEQPVNSHNDLHLRSTKNVSGYGIHATDGEIGKVVDYIVDDTTWKIKFLVVETGSWLDSRKVLLSTQWIKEVNWDNSVVIVDITTEAVKGSPEFDASQPVNEAYENNLYDYYGRRKE